MTAAGTRREADYVIAGGGTAGAVIARRLADRGAEVVLIEAGPTGADDPRVRMLSRWDELLGTELDFDHTVEGMERGNDLLRYSTAKVLGGCSSHNTCIAFRAPDWDMDEWVRLGASGWGAATSAAYFDRVFDRVHVEGPLRHHPWASAFVEAGRQAGVPATDFREPNVRNGIGWFQANKRGDWRESSAVAYLFPLDDLPGNLTLLTEESAVRVLIGDDGAARGVVTDRGTVMAREEVIVCCGAFGSPRLLLLSGIGPEEHLRDVGIEPRVDLPVGEHLIDHPEGIVLWEATDEISEACSHWETGVFVTIDADAGFPELMAHLTTMRFDLNTAARGYPTADAVFSMHPNVTRARSEGFVRLRSTDPGAPLHIDPRHYSDPEGYDERILVEGIRFARRLAEQPALAAVIARELAPGPAVQDEEELSEYARRTGNTVYHPAGTCRMGAADDARAVVDPDLRVRGVERLRVADASVFPCMTTVNPCITVMMIGERCSDLLLSASPARAAQGSAGR
jgi:choline oxidase